MISVVVGLGHFSKVELRSFQVDLIRAWNSSELQRCGNLVIFLTKSFKNLCLLLVISSSTNEMALSGIEGTKHPGNRLSRAILILQNSLNLRQTSMSPFLSDPWIWQTTYFMKAEPRVSWPSMTSLMFSSNYDWASREESAKRPNCWWLKAALVGDYSTDDFCYACLGFSGDSGWGSIGSINVKQTRYQNHTSPYTTQYLSQSISYIIIAQLPSSLFNISHYSAVRSFIQAIPLSFKIFFARLLTMISLGHIQLILGPMFSGKSSEMLRKVRRYQHAKKRCIVVNYLNDNRYSFEDVASTHDKLTKKAVKTSTLQEIYERLREHNVVAIDEGQFFPDIVEVSERLANEGVVVIIAALDGTFQRKPFNKILSLVPLAEQVIKLSAVCIDCGKEAAFTRRTVASQEVELIGGEESYKPVCRKCFNSTCQLEQPQNILEEKSANLTNPELKAPLKLLAE